MTKIEEVARAIYEKRNGHGCKAWGHQPSSHKAPYLSDARAAIEAMRVPTPKMISQTLPLTGMHCDPRTIKLAERALFFLEGPTMTEQGHRDGMESAQTLITDWYSMIDAALSEGEERG